MMKRIMMILGVSGAMFFATTGAQCDAKQLMNFFGALCPECYAHYLSLHPGANQ